MPYILCGVVIKYHITMCKTSKLSFNNEYKHYCYFEVSQLAPVITESCSALCTLRHAKKEQLRIWKGFTPAVAPEISPKAKNFTGKVMEIGNGDNLVVKTGDGACQKIYFSSFRPPRYREANLFSAYVYILLTLIGMQ